MTTTTFDTLTYFEKLKAAGMPESHAEAITKAQAEAIKDFVAARELATKGDLQGLRSELIERISATENRILRWMVGGFITQTALLVAILAFLQ